MRRRPVRRRIDCGPAAVVDDARYPGHWYVISTKTGRTIGGHRTKLLEALAIAQTIALDLR